MSKMPDQIVITLTLSDEKWPNITAVGSVQGTCLKTETTAEKQQYDLAYNKFEVTLHNLLRKAVDELIRRRKQAGS